MKFFDCYKVLKGEQIIEGYKKLDDHVLVNVDKDNISILLNRFLKESTDPLFFILETPCTKQEEDEINKNKGNVGFHKKVYYIDGLDKEKIVKIFNEDLEFMCNSGITYFGFGSHVTDFELFVDKFNSIVLYGDKELNEKVLNSLGYTEQKEFVSAWDSFSKNSPGEVIVQENGNKNLDILLNKYKSLGMYFAEIRDEF